MLNHKNIKLIQHSVKCRQYLILQDRKKPLIPEFLDNDTFFAILPQYFITTDLNQTIKMRLNWQDFSFNSSSFTNCINSLGVRDVFILGFFLIVFNNNFQGLRGNWTIEC